MLSVCLSDGAAGQAVHVCEPDASSLRAAPAGSAAPAAGSRALRHRAAGRRRQDPRTQGGAGQHQPVLQGHVHREPVGEGDVRGGVPVRG